MNQNKTTNTCINMATKKSPTEKSRKKSTTKKSSAKKTSVVVNKVKTKETPVLRLIKNDAYLEAYSNAINGRHNRVFEKLNSLTNKGKMSLNDFATGYLYFGR